MAARYTNKRKVNDERQQNGFKMKIKQKKYLDR